MILLRGTSIYISYTLILDIIDVQIKLNKARLTAQFTFDLSTTHALPAAVCACFHPQWQCKHTWSTTADSYTFTLII